MQGFDLSTLDTTGPSDVPTKMELRHPADATQFLEYPTDDKGTTARSHIMLLGLESSVAKRLKRRFQARRLGRLEQGKKMGLTPDALDEERLDLYVALTQGWAGISWKGQPLDCTPPNVRMLYEERTWVLDQIQEHTGDLSNYLGNFESSSSDSPGASSGLTSE